jgi:hypothetical protein
MWASTPAIIISASFLLRPQKEQWMFFSSLII